MIAPAQDRFKRNRCESATAEALSAKRRGALLALKALADRVPTAPGFEAYDICETAETFEQDPESWLQLNATGAVLNSLSKKELVARSSGCLKGAAEMVIDSESGWVLTRRGSTVAASL